MSIENALQARSESKCELCGSTDDLAIYEVPPVSDGGVKACVYLCNTCREQIDAPDKLDVHHWRCLNDSMWTAVPAVQVMAWRMLNRLRDESWARDLLDMLYLDEETQSWAQEGEDENDDGVKHLDSNGARLQSGDTVTLIKDLNVKGAGFTAKRGTAVRGISLVPDNAKQIDGRINAQQIVILTEFVKKSA